MSWKGLEKAQNICFSKHEKLVISHGENEKAGDRQCAPSPLPHHVSNFGCSAVSDMYFFSVLK